MTHGPDPARWAQVNAIFHDALAQPTSDRQAFVDRACGEDHTLRADVLSLLAAHDRPGGPLDLPDAGRSPMDLLAGPPPDLLSAGSTVGPYRIERLIGTGGMGVVYLAEDTRLGRHVALKALAWELTGDDRHRERLRREARAAAALTHPNVATVYAIEEIDGRLFLVTEYLPGTTLRARIARGPSPLAEVLSIAGQVAAGLSAAHSRGIVHRDLKPENVIESPDGRAKVLDFGIAWHSDAGAEIARLTDHGASVGTPAYMAPEQIRAEPVDARTDIFALGVLLHELLTGTPPFAGATPSATMARILDGKPPHLLAALPSPPPPGQLASYEAMEALIEKCLAANPKDRFGSVAEVERELRKVPGAEGPKVRGTDGPKVRWSEGPVAPSRVWWQFHQAAASVGYLVLLVPLWLTRGWPAPPIGRAIFLTGLVAALVATTFRLHLWFASRELRSEWPAQRARLAPWIRAADWVLALDLFAAGIANLGEHETGGVLFIAGAIAVFVAGTVIEPATARAAEREGKPSPAD